MTTVRDAIAAAFAEEMENDERVFIIGEEVGASGGHMQTTAGLLARFGWHRVVDAPISEAGFTGLAVGASFCGLRPVVDFMNWGFSLQAIDHIVNSCAKTSYMSGGRITCPIVFRGPAGYNAGFAAQHTQEFFSWYGSVPGLKVVAPYTVGDHRRLLKSAIRDDGPVVFLENECLYGREEHDLGYSGQGAGNDSEMQLQRLDRAVVLRKGSDVTIVGVSFSLSVVEEAATHAESSIEIINLISLRPIDIKTIVESVKKTGRLIVVDFSWPHFGVASEISAMVYARLYGQLKCRIECLTGADTHVGYAKELEEMFYPTADQLVELVNKMHVR